MLYKKRYAGMVPLVCLIVTGILLFTGGCGDKKKKHHDEQKAAAVMTPVPDPVGTWQPTSTGANCPEPRDSHFAFWAESKMIVWGGHTDTDYYSNTGGIYDPVTDTWEATSLGENCPIGAGGSSAVWTGESMIICGGYRGGTPMGNSNGIFHPDNNSWSSMSNKYYATVGHSAVWTGNSMIIWGGTRGGDCGTGRFYGYDTGSIYFPDNDTWIEMTTDNAPTGRWDHIAVWTGSEMIIMAGISEAEISKDVIYAYDVAAYNPETDSWRPMSGYQAFIEDYAFLSGTEIIVPVRNTIQIYNIVSESWTIRLFFGFPYPWRNYSSVYTGTELILWGGDWVGTQASNLGSIYNFVDNSWTPTDFGPNCPEGRMYHSAVWTGSEMIIWGGKIDASVYTNTGGIFTP